MMNKEDVFEFLIFDEIPYFVKASEISKCKMHVIPKRTKNPIIYYRKLKEILTTGQYDVIWYNVCTLCDITLLKIAKKQKVPCRVVHSHNGANMGGKLVAFFHAINKRIIERYATDFWACSNVAANFMFPPKVIEEKGVKIVKNAIDSENYQYDSSIREKKRNMMNISSELVIGHVGRFHFQKNHQFILKIFEEIVKRDNNTKLLLVGNGELKKQFCEKAKEKGIYQHIIILENRTDVNELLQAMDVFLFPSLFEGLPISLIEAQAASLPCVISDTISEEVLITNENVILSLKDPIKKWAECVLESGYGSKRVNQVEVLKAKGYDINENAKHLKDYIRNLLE